VSSLDHLLGCIRCPYLRLHQMFYLVRKSGKEIFNIFPSFNNLCPGLDIYAGHDGNSQGTFGFFLKDVLGSPDLFFVTNAHVVNYEHCVDPKTRRFVFSKQPQILPSEPVSHPSNAKVQATIDSLMREHASSSFLKKIFIRRKLAKIEGTSKHLIGNVVFSSFGWKRW